MMFESASYKTQQLRCITPPFYFFYISIKEREVYVAPKLAVRQNFIFITALRSRPTVYA